MEKAQRTDSLRLVPGRPNPGRPLGKRAGPDQTGFLRAQLTRLTRQYRQTDRLIDRRERGVA